MLLILFHFFKNFVQKSQLYLQNFICLTVSEQLYSENTIISKITSLSDSNTSSALFSESSIPLLIVKTVLCGTSGSGCFNFLPLYFLFFCSSGVWLTGVWLDDGIFSFTGIYQQVEASVLGQLYKNLTMSFKKMSLLINYCLNTL